MIEILFRGKRLDNGEWVCGYLYVYWNFVKKIFQILGDRTNGIPDAYEVDPSTVGMYIDRIDKTGVRIFQNDFVKTKYGRICQVVWFEPKLRWDLKPVANLDCKAPDEWDMWNSENLEVVGNIDDNPGLLEETK